MCTEMGRSKPRKSRKSLFSSEEQGEEFEKYPNGMHHVISFKSCSRKVKELIDDNDSLINKSVHSSTLKRLVKTKHIKEVLAAKPSLAGSVHQEGIVDESSRIVDSNEYMRELTAHALNGMTSADFRDRMLSSLRTYKAMSTLDAATRPVFQPYLRRNLLYRLAFTDRPVPSFTFGEEEPPLVWPWAPVRKVALRSVRERKARLREVIDAHIARGAIEEDILRREDVRNFRFSIGTLAEFKRTKNRQSLYGSLAFRKYLKANGMSVEIPSRVTAEPLTGNNRIANLTCPCYVSEDSATLSFRMVCHQLLEGERLAKVQVYTVRQKGDVFEKAEKLPSATFTVSVNMPMSPISIDVPAISSDSQLRVHVVVRVDVTNNLKGIRVDGHALRHLPSRIIRSDSANQDHRVTFEHTLLGTRCLYKNDTSWSGGSGFISGESNVILIEQDKLNHDIHSTVIVSELEYWTKRLHSNPFLQMRIVCGPIYDDESDCCLSERSSRSSDGVEGDDELSACSEAEDAPQRVELKRTIDPYLGIFRSNEEGRYTNDVQTIEAIFRPLKSMGRTNLVIVQNWLRLEIPPLITYRISSGMVPHDENNVEGQTIYEGKPVSRLSDYASLTELSDYASLTEVQKMGWITVVDQYQTDKCIVCGRSFHNMYALMLHYHLSYPRLTFQLNLRIDPQQHENWHRLHVDVFLNPDFDDVHEVITDGKGNWIRVGDPMFIWTRDQAIELRSKLRMDLTIFCDSLRSAGQTLDDPVEERHFIHPESGRWLYRGERLPRYARHLPAPGHEVLIHNATRRLLDFVDLSDGSKWFMITWNTMMITLGKARCDEAGPYWLNLSFLILYTRRLFLELHMDTMVRYRQRSHFIYHLNTQTQRGRLITDLEDLVLRLYYAKHDYDPLMDELHPLRDWIYADLKRGFERYRSDLDKPHKDSSGMRRSFPKMYRTDPSTISNDQLHRLFIEILEAGVVLPFNHPFRKYLLNVVDVLFEGHMPPCVASLRDQDDFLCSLIRGG
ncbi:hypothetical protein Q1695_000031 [Nippostrongylus brasiliensis]|nr:hypothetical protein Q1695_000031 [Nippostrongylus brasiliensis]